MVLFLTISQVRISILMKILCLLLFATMSPAESFILVNSDDLDSWKNILIAIVI